MTCRYCNKPLGFLQRVSGHHYCSAAHQKAHQQEQEQAAIERLRHTVVVPQVEPKPEPKPEPRREAKPVEPEPKPAPQPVSSRPAPPPPAAPEPVRPVEPVASMPVPPTAPPIQQPLTPSAGQTVPSTEEIPLPAFLTKGRKRDAPRSKKAIDRALIEDLDDVPLPSFLMRGAKAKAKNSPDETPADPAVPAPETAAPSRAPIPTSADLSGTDEIQVPASVSKRRRAMDAAKPPAAEPVAEVRAEEPASAVPVPEAPATAEPAIAVEAGVAAEAKTVEAQPEIASVATVEPLVVAEAESGAEAEPLAVAEAVDAAASHPAAPSEPEPEFDRYELPKLNPLAWEAPGAVAPGEAAAWAGDKLEPVRFAAQTVAVPAAALRLSGQNLDAPPERAIGLQPALPTFQVGSVKPAAAPLMVHEQPANMALLVPVGPDVEPLLQAPQQAVPPPQVRERGPVSLAVEPFPGGQTAAGPDEALRVATFKRLELESGMPSGSAHLDLAAPLAIEVSGQETPAAPAAAPETLRGHLTPETPSAEIAAIPASPELAAVGWLPLGTRAAEVEAQASQETDEFRGMARPPLASQAVGASEPDPRALSEMFAPPERRTSTFDAKTLAAEGTAAPRRDSWTPFAPVPCQVPDMTFEPVPVQLALEVTAESQAPMRPIRSRFRKPVALQLSGRDVRPLPKLVPVGCDFRSAPLARASLS